MSNDMCSPNWKNGIGGERCVQDGIQTQKPGEGNVSTSLHVHVCTFCRKVAWMHTSGVWFVFHTRSVWWSAETRMRPYAVDSAVVALAQVASTSKGGDGQRSERGGDSAGNQRTATIPTREPAADTRNTRDQHIAGADAGAPEVLMLREGQTLPEGYTLVVCDPRPLNIATLSPDILDLTTPPDRDAHMVEEDVDVEKRAAAAKRNVRRSTNKHAHTSFVKEVKVALAGGEPPSIHVSENETHLKARWHSAAKECAYKLLDLRKEGWKHYTLWDKERVHKELIRHYKFDPPLDPKVVDKYLAGHLRSSRAVWKSHWLKHGDKGRHPNCPEEAWAKLIKWWCTDQCMEESADMAGRRARVQNNSKSGRKRLVDRMENQVRQHFGCEQHSVIVRHNSSARHSGHVCHLGDFASKS